MHNIYFFSCSVFFQSGPVTSPYDDLKNRSACCRGWTVSGNNWKVPQSLFWGQVSHPLYCPSTSRPTGTLSFRCALKRSRFKFEQGYPTKVGLSLLKDTNDTFHCCASCWDAVCLCVAAVLQWQSFKWWWASFTIFTFWRVKHAVRFISGGQPLEFGRQVFCTHRAPFFVCG